MQCGRRLPRLVLPTVSPAFRGPMLRPDALWAWVVERQMLQFAWLPCVNIALCSCTQWRESESSRQHVA